MLIPLKKKQRRRRNRIGSIIVDNIFFLQPFPNGEAVKVTCKSETAPAGIDDPPKPTKTLTELQTIRALSDKMESVEQVADAEGMLSEVESAADMMIYRLDVCFEHYPEFLENPNIRQRVVELLQKAKEYIVKLEGEFAYD